MPSRTTETPYVPPDDLGEVPSPEAKFYAWQFHIPDNAFRKLASEDQPPPREGQATVVEVCGCLAVVIARNQTEAYETLVERAKREGLDYRWLRVADVHRVDIDVPCRLCWVGA